MPPFMSKTPGPVIRRRSRRTGGGRACRRGTRCRGGRRAARAARHRRPVHVRPVRPVDAPGAAAGAGLQQRRPPPRRRRMRSRSAEGDSVFTSSSRSASIRSRSGTPAILSRRAPACSMTPVNRRDAGRVPPRPRDALQPEDVGLPGAVRGAHPACAGRRSPCSPACRSPGTPGWSRAGQSTPPSTCSRHSPGPCASTTPRRHLLTLADARTVHEPIIEDAPDGLVRLITAMEPSPAYMVARGSTSSPGTARSRCSTRRSTGWSRRERNLLWVVFAEARLGIDRRMGRAGPAPARRVRALTARCATSRPGVVPGRAAARDSPRSPWWSEQDVAGFQTRLRPYHPRNAGELVFEYQQLTPTWPACGSRCTAGARRRQRPAPRRLAQHRLDPATRLEEVAHLAARPVELPARWRAPSRRRSARARSARRRRTGPRRCRPCLGLVAEMEAGSVVTLLCDGGERYAHNYYDDDWGARPRLGARRAEPPGARLPRRVAGSRRYCARRRGAGRCRRPAPAVAPSPAARATRSG